MEDQLKEKRITDDHLIKLIKISIAKQRGSADREDDQLTEKRIS